MITSFLQRFLGSWRRPTDGNVVDFPKYRKHGAYHWRSIETDEVYRRMVNFVADLLPQPGRCLDLGCGDAAYVGQLGFRGHAVYGIDADFHAIRLARRELRRKGLENCQVWQSPVGRLLQDPSHKQQYDLVISMDVIEHLPDPAELLQVALYCCRPGGVICIGTPAFRSHETISPFHLREYRPEEFQEVMSRYCESVQLHRLAVRREQNLIIDDGYLCAVGCPRLLAELPLRQHGGQHA